MSASWNSRDAVDVVGALGSQLSGADTVRGKTVPKGNKGHSGHSIDNSSKTSGIAGALTDKAIATYRPKIILLMIGTNDMHHSIDLANAPTRLGSCGEMRG